MKLRQDILDQGARGLRVQSGYECDSSRYLSRGLLITTALAVCVQDVLAAIDETDMMAVVMSDGIEQPVELTVSVGVGIDTAVVSDVIAAVLEQRDLSLLSDVTITELVDELYLDIAPLVVDAIYDDSVSYDELELSESRDIYLDGLTTVAEPGEAESDDSGSSSSGSNNKWLYIGGGVAALVGVVAISSGGSGGGGAATTPIDTDSITATATATDTDSDGVVDASDAFPLDSTESVDTDGDGTGNNADTDDDGDGILDASDALPLDSTESVDTDGDGTGNNADTDDDGDGVVDASDAFPLDSTESVDTDGDGTGNNADTDDDGDGILDASDAFPLDSTESVDTDGDGTGNNADIDDDSDGILDVDDNCQYVNNSHQSDLDEDGIGFQCDPCINIEGSDDCVEIIKSCTGTDEDDYIIASCPSSDPMMGKEGDDFLVGEKGNDVMYGEKGNDVMYGGDGNDILHGGKGDDYLLGGEDDDAIDGGDGIDAVFQTVDADQKLENNKLTGQGVDSLNSIEGAVLRGGNSNNTIDASAFTLGGVVLYGMGGNDKLYGSIENDSLYGGYGSDRMYGGYGSDRMDGGYGSDRMDGGYDDDLMYGGDGADTMFGGATTILREYGNDTMHGGDGADTMFGEDGDDRMYGGDGNDGLHGGDGDDHMYGGDGNDSLDGGGGGYDTMDGGEGVDTAIFGGIQSNYTVNNKEAYVKVTNTLNEIYKLYNIEKLQFDDYDFIDEPTLKSASSCDDFFNAEESIVAGEQGRVLELDFDCQPTAEADGIDVLVTSVEDIYGFQIELLENCNDSVSLGRDSVSAGFMSSASSGVALGFSLSSDFIPGNTGQPIHLVTLLDDYCL